MPVYTIKTPNGRELDIDAPDEATAMTGANDWYKQNVTDKTNTSFVGAVNQGVSEVVRGVGKTVKEYGSAERGAAIEKTGQGLTDPKYKSATDSFFNPGEDDTKIAGYGVNNIPRALAEQGPGMLTDIGSMILARKFLGNKGALAVGTGVHALRTGGDNAQQRAEGRTGDATASPTTEDKIIGGASTAAQSALNSVGVGAIINPARVAGLGAKGVATAAGNVGRAAAVEGATEMAQETLSQAASTVGTDKGLRVNPHEIVGSGILGAAGGGAFSTPRGAKDAITATRFRDLDYGEDTARAANRISSKVESTSELDNANTSFNAVKAAMADAKNELRTASKGFTATTQEADNALARAKRGEALDQNDLDAVDGQNDANLSSLVRQITVINRLTGKGRFDQKSERFAGGMGETIRSYTAGHPLLASGAGGLGMYAMQNGAKGFDQLAGAIPGVMESAATVYGGYKGLQAIDRITGMNSPAKAFTEAAANGSTLRPPVERPTEQTVPNVPVPSDLSEGPWGPRPGPEVPFKPDTLGMGLQKIVSGIEKRHQKDQASETTKLLKQLAARQKAEARAEKEAQRMEDGMQKQAQAVADQKQDEFISAIREGRAMMRAHQGAAARKAKYEAQEAKETAKAEKAAAAQPEAELQSVIKQMRDMMKSRQLVNKMRDQTLGAQQAEAEAATSPIINENGGLDALRNPAFGKRASQLLGAANAMRKLRNVPEQDSTDAPIAPEAPQGPEAQPQAQREFVLPESRYWMEEPSSAADKILADAIRDGKDIRNKEGYRASTKRRLEGEEAIYNAISKELPNVEAKGVLHKYLSALWGSDSPSVVRQVREAMKAELPEHAHIIDKHLTDEKIDSLWTKPK